MLIRDSRVLTKDIGVFGSRFLEQAYQHTASGCFSARCVKLDMEKGEIVEQSRLAFHFLPSLKPLIVRNQDRGKQDFKHELTPKIFTSRHWSPESCFLGMGRDRGGDIRSLSTLTQLGLDILHMLPKELSVDPQKASQS